MRVPSSNRPPGVPMTGLPVTGLGDISRIIVLPKSWQDRFRLWSFKKIHKDQLFFIEFVFF